MFKPLFTAIWDHVRHVRNRMGPDLGIGVVFAAACICWKYFLGGGLSINEFASSAIPAIWTFLLMLIYWTAQAALSLRKADLARWENWTPFIVGSPKPEKPRWLKVAFPAMIFILGFVGIFPLSLFVIPTNRQDDQALSQSDRSLFVQNLSAKFLARPELTISCAAYSEPDCIVASQFARLFAIANWPLATAQVQRRTMTSPSAGISIHNHTDGKPDHRDPLVGNWRFKSQAFDQLVAAFEAINIEPIGFANSQVPKGNIEVHFGYKSLARASTSEMESTRRSREELLRRMGIVERLIKKYQREFTVNDKTPIPAEWINKQLRVLGETWQTENDSQNPTGLIIHGLNRGQPSDNPTLKR